MTAEHPALSPWARAALAAALFAVDPAGTGGVTLRAAPGPVRERWLKLLRGLLPPGPFRPIPVAVGEGRLLGGLDLVATLAAGRPVAERGLLAEADGGTVLLSMAERVGPLTASHLAAALDRGEVAVERDGLALRQPARFGVVACDEGITDDERPPAALRDRLAFSVDLAAIAVRDTGEDGAAAAAVAAARARLPQVAATDAAIEALCGAAVTLGIESLRAPLLALKVARAAAALAGRDAVSDEDAALAAGLVLAPRATRWQAPDEQRPEPPAEAPEDASQPDASQDDRGDRPIDDVVLAAAQAAIPAGLLAHLIQGPALRDRARQAGRAGAVRPGGMRGRPVGTRRGELRSGGRLSLVETLRAAAPWQPLRRGAPGQGSAQIEVRRDDLRLTRYEERAQTTTIFVVDASGSAALHRLAECKGAVELLLADCYVRRDRVALIAFRGRGAELLLPPTRSLVRAKRSLASLPGGGGTPLASGIEAAAALADALRRRGDTPVMVVLTDGRANVGRDGAGGRKQAEADALAAARLARAGGVASLLIDTSPQPRREAGDLAAAMGAVYLPLPHADATALSAAVRAGAGRRGRAAQ